MNPLARIEQAVEAAIGSVERPGCPPGLSAAMRYAAIPGGARIRPKLCLAVAGACGADDPALVDAAATSIELLHCASLVHDDLPCFDNADTRRGKPSVHRAFGQPLAVLTGDALIVLAFELLARAGRAAPSRLADLTLIVARSVGGPTGIVAGQAWECEQALDLSQYHREKTGSLFVAATMAGAAAAGYEADGWRALGRPNVVNSFGVTAAVERLEDLLTKAQDSIPDCPGREALGKLVRKEASSFVPKKLLRVAA